METAFPTPPIYRITIPGLLRDKSRPLGLDREGRGVSFTPVKLPDDIDFLMRPVLAGLCHMESRDNGALDLEAFALMNDALDAKAENENRARAVREASHG
ncbi:DUF6889 family protein [Acetobacter tropicalis]|uniref:DUF6889 family protein n=1 Tax=Acetobacter tropicalis TaxID=104102 RepID=UPI000A366FB9|nr:hypothetical protein [Acetobacter tropicalis]